MAKKDPGTDVMEVPSNQLPDFMAEAAGKYAGAGVSTKAEDNLIPRFRILQDLSSEVKSRDPAYIDGAVVGDIYMPSIRRLWKAAEGFLFQPCAFMTAWVERDSIADGGAFYGQYPEPPEGTTQVDKNKWSYNGHELVDTRYHFGFIVGEKPDDITMPSVMTLSSTGHTISKAWTTLMNTHRLPDGRTAPSWARLYRVRTVLRRKGKNEWFVYDISNYGWVRDKNQFDAGAGLYESVMAGDKRADESDVDPASEADPNVPF